MAIETVNPTTGERLKTFPPLDAAAIEDALARAHHAAARWRSAQMKERTKVVRRAADLLDERKRDYGRLMTLEMGKTYKAALEEVAKCAGALRYFAEHGPSFVSDEPVRIDGETSYVAFQPIGVVLAVMPWNFPFWQVIRFAAPALVAGNVGLLKHASNVPQCSLALEQLFRDAGAPEGVFQSLLIPSDVVAEIIADDRVAAVTLTGSEAAGRSVAACAGQHLKKTVLELGGSDPFVIMPSADLDAAVSTAVAARAINNGQSCIAAKRFIVADDIADAFISRFVDATRRLVVGDPMDERTNVGPLATAKIREELHRQVTRSVAAGSRVLLGGEPLQRPGYFYAPTVLVCPSRDVPVLREETFGPVAAVARVRDLDEAIRVANETSFGLGAAAWTRDEYEAQRFAHEIEAGSVFINGMVASDSRFPFGGIKRSGYGRELAAFGMREFVNIKTVRQHTGPTTRTSAAE